MGLGATAKHTSVRGILGDACARNVSADIQYDGPDGMMATVRVRLLAIEKGLLCTDRPHNLDGTPELRPGQRVTMYLQLANTRWAFETRVRRTHRPVQLNQRQRIMGMGFGIPGEIKVQQRRREFRVSLVSYGIAAALQAVSAKNEFACDIDCDRFKATIVNVSLGGMAVLVQQIHRQTMDFGEAFFIEFRLPDDEENLVKLVDVRHVHKIERSQATVAGLRFLPAAVIDETMHDQKLTAFIAAEQRRKLRRKR